MLIIYLVTILEIFSSCIQKKNEETKRKILSIKETKSNQMMRLFFYIDIYSFIELIKILSNKKTARQNREQINIVNGNNDGQIEKTERRNKKKKKRKRREIIFEHVSLSSCSCILTKILRFTD
jgi:hypothetical protein